MAIKRDLKMGKWYMVGEWWVKQKRWEGNERRQQNKSTSMAQLQLLAWLHEPHNTLIQLISSYISPSIHTPLFLTSFIPPLFHPIYHTLPTIPSSLFLFFNNTLRYTFSLYSTTRKHSRSEWSRLNSLNWLLLYWFEYQSFNNPL